MRLTFQIDTYFENVQAERGIIITIRKEDEAMLLRALLGSGTVSRILNGEVLEFTQDIPGLAPPPDWIATPPERPLYHAICLAKEKGGPFYAGKWASHADHGIVFQVNSGPMLPGFQIEKWKTIEG